MAYLTWRTTTENMTPTERIEAFDQLSESERNTILSSAFDFLEMEENIGKKQKPKSKTA